MSATSASIASRAGRVALLYGGWSAEREISLITGTAVLEALHRQGVDAVAVDTRHDAVRTLLEGNFDSAWIALHGRGGEDGTVQGLLEYLGLPYTGSGVAASAICMDKLRSKQLFRAADLSTPEWAVLNDTTDLAPAIERLGLPLMIKPASEGSSVGMSRVDSAAELAGAFASARALDTCVLAEEWIDGPEYTAGILGSRVLPLIHIETPKAFYDYEAKYHSDQTQYHCPSGLPDAVEAGYAAQALQAFEALGTEGWGRVDFLLDDDGNARFLEVNTIPGMTSHSLVPMAAKQAGIEFDTLVMRILDLGLETPRSASEVAA